MFQEEITAQKINHWDRKRYFVLNPPEIPSAFFTSCLNLPPLMWSSFSLCCWVFMLGSVVVEWIRMWPIFCVLKTERTSILEPNPMWQADMTAGPAVLRGFAFLLTSLRLSRLLISHSFLSPHTLCWTLKCVGKKKWQLFYCLLLLIIFPDYQSPL